MAPCGSPAAGRLHQYFGCQPGSSWSVTRWLGIVAMLFAASCSPYPYAPAVKKFAGGVDDVSSGLSSNDAVAMGTSAALGRFARRDQSPHPEMALSLDCFKPPAEGGHCERVAVGKQLNFRTPGESLPMAPPVANRIKLPASAPDSFKCPVVESIGPSPTPENLQKITITATVLASKLKDYADGLTAITNAADRAQLDSAISDLSKSAGGLAGAVGMAAGPVTAAATGAVVSAGISLVGWIIGTAEDQRRFEALDNTLRVTCEPIRVLAEAADTLIDARLVQIADDRRAAAITILKGMQGGMGREEFAHRDQEVDDLLAAGIRPPDTGKNLGSAFRAAHDALVKAVINREGQTAELIAAVGNFADVAKALNDSLKKPKA
jgi:hypothetical protein